MKTTSSQTVIQLLGNQGIKRLRVIKKLQEADRDWLLNWLNREGKFGKTAYELVDDAIAEWSGSKPVVAKEKKPKVETSTPGAMFSPKPMTSKGLWQETPPAPPVEEPAAPEEEWTQEYEAKFEDTIPDWDEDPEGWYKAAMNIKEEKGSINKTVEALGISRPTWYKRTKAIEEGNNEN